ncbi:hypothetical protein BEWA_007680 [Theileria equi strain WA]|uniref:Uncharacterized protein n=1 Tax=Theileria equi strain WA TaxID=1537102 RepID=L0B2M1_THEEQ|nr:hypothetical protein BEWA_007680 [Theileria equi strain WA]AFZ81359.1 hypothetical protein BEWA_007680 [Theileria equi strain WA]|eukprot:XP_004831025.1 hypothetical protein BEWA_007680 [Theileria equi strain WA]
MVVWSSYSESFYLSLRERVSEYGQKNRALNTDFLKHSVESSPLFTSVECDPPYLSSSANVEVNTLSGILGDTWSNELGSTLTDRFNHNTSVVYKSTDNTSTKRINSFYGLSGNVNKGIYALSYENSNYLSCNLSRFSNRGIYKKNFVRILEQEIVNSLDVVHLYDEKNRQRYRKVMIKPCGSLNAGIHGLEIQIDSNPSNIHMDCIERFRIHPSSFFCKERYRQNVGKFCSNSNPHFGLHGNDTEDTKIYEHIHSTNTSYSDFDILEIKTDDKNLLSSIFYARNNFGLFIGRYYYKDNGWIFEQLSSKSYSVNEKIFYISVSPYASGECMFLKSTNKIALYDTNISEEYHTISLSNYIDEDTDIIQTVCYGIDSNSAIFGGNRLYHFDLRANRMDPLIYKPSDNITVTSSAWTERHYHSSKHPLKHFTHLLSGPSCSFSNYWRISKPNYWSSFTACQTHPVHSHIFACIYSTSNCIYLFDLRTPIAPILEIPLPSTEYIGARFRHLVWSKSDSNSGDEHTDYTVLLAFCWKQKKQVYCEFLIDSSCSTFSCNDPSYSVRFEVFENFNTRINFKHSKSIDFCNVDEKEERNHFASTGPLIETLESYSKLPFHFPADNSLTDIFHGYLGTLIVIDNNCKMLFIYTISGRLLCLDSCNRNIILKNTGYTKNTGKFEQTQLDLSNDDGLESGFEGFICTSLPETDLSLPNDFIFDRIVKYVKISNVVCENKLDLVPSNLSDNITCKSEQSNFDMNICPNYTFFNDFKTILFRPKEILNSLLFPAEERKKVWPAMGSVMSLLQLEEICDDPNIFGDNIVNIWNTNELWIDYDYDEECATENNPFVISTPSCSCSLFSKRIKNKKDHLVALLTSCRACTSYKSRTDLNYLTNEQEVIDTEYPTLQYYLTKYRDNISIKTRSEAKSIGNTFLLHSPVLPSLVSERKKYNTAVHTDCYGTKNLISVKIRKNDTSTGSNITDNNEAKTKITQLTNFWRLTPDDEIIHVSNLIKYTLLQNNGENVIKRFKKYTNQIEILKKSKEEQDKIIAKLLQRTNTKL